MRVSRKPFAALFTVVSFAPSACLVYLQGTKGAYAGPINTMTLCGNASYCLFDSDNYNTPLAAEQAFVAAVGSNPLGQQNFGGYSAGTYPGGVYPLYSLAAEISGYGAGPLSVITGGPVGGGIDVGASQGFELTLGGQYYYGYSYAETGRNTSAVGIAPGSQSLGTLTLASSGFFGIITRAPLSENESAIQLTGAGSGPTYIDGVLYAGDPAIGPNNPLYPEQQMAGNDGTGGTGCNGFFCDIWDDVEAVGAAITVAGETAYTYGGYFDPSGANAYTYETLNGALFTSVGGFPSGFSSGFDVSGGGTDYGLFGPGQTLTFPGGGVTRFTISGINPTVDGSSPIAFPVDIALNQNNAEVEAIAFDQSSSTPERASIFLCVVGGLIFLGARLIGQMSRLKLRCGCLLFLIVQLPASASTIADSGAGFASGIQAYVFGTSPGAILVPASPSLTYSASQSDTSGGATSSTSVDISPAADNIGLHGLASSDAQSQSDSGANFDLYFYDQFNITGTGPETFQYTLTLNGSASLTGDPPTDGSSLSYGGLSLYANSSYQTWGAITADNGCGGLCGIIDSIRINAQSTANGSTVTGDLNLDGGTSVELGLYLWARTDADNFSGSADIFAEVNAADTGFFTLTPMTAGAGFTTASGLTYATDPDSSTPEPGPFLLCFFGIAGLLAVRQLRASTAKCEKRV